MALDLGELNVTIGANTDALKAAVPAFNRLEKAIDKLTSSVDKMNNNIAASYKKMADNTQKAVSKQTSAVEKGKKKQEKTVLTSLRKVQTLEKQAASEAEETAKDKYNRETQAFLHAIERQKKLLKEKEAAEKRAAKASQKVVDDGKKYTQQRKAVLGATKSLRNLRIEMEHYGKSEKEIDDVSRAFGRYIKTVRSAGAASKEASVAKTNLDQRVSKVRTSFKKAEPPMNKFQVGMQDMAKSTQVALGPLSGVASRLTAMTALFNKNAAVVSLVLGTYAGLSVVMAKSVAAGARMEKQLYRIGNALDITGKSAQFTVDEVNKVAVGLAEATLTSTEFARDAAAALLSFSGVSKNAFEGVLYLAQDLSSTFGGGLMENTKRLGKVFENPVKGLRSMREAGVDFTDAERDVIESLVRTGKSSEATGKILEKVSSQVGGNAKKEAQGLAGAWDTLGERFTSFFEQVGGKIDEGNSLASAISNISDEVKRFTEDSSAVQALGASFGATLRGMADAVLFLAKNFEVVTKSVLAFTAAVTVYKGGGLLLDMATGLATVTSNTWKYVASTKAAGKATQFFNTAIKRNPVGLLLTALAAAASSLILFWEDTEQATEGLDRFNKKTKEAKTNLEELSNAAKVGQLRESIQGWEVQLTSLRGQLASVVALAGKTGNVDAYKDSIDAIVKTIAALEEKIKGAKGEVKDLNAETAAHNFRGNLDALIELKDGFVDTSSEIKKFNELNEALGGFADNFEGKLTPAMVEYAEAAGYSKEELTKMVDTLRFIEENTSAFDSSINKIKDLQAEAAHAANRQLVLAEAGEEAAKRLDNAFAQQQAFTEYYREAIPKSVEELRAMADQLGIVGNKEMKRADLVLAVARAQAELNVAADNDSSADNAEKASKGYAQLLSKLRDAKAATEALNNLSTGQKVMGFFDPSIIDNAVNAKVEFEKLKRTVSELSSTEMEDLATKINDLGKQQGLGELIKPEDVGNVEKTAEAFKTLQDNTDSASVSWQDFASTMGTIGGQLNDIFSRQLSQYQEMAAYQAKMAQEALDYGQTQVDLYTRLAEQTKYTNAEISKSFEDKALAAARSAEQEYRARQQQREAANQQAKQAFENQKKLQVAQAIMNTASAVMRAYSDLPYWAAIPASAAITALGAQQVATIQQQQYTPRQRGGSIVGGKPYMVGEAGPELIVPNSGGTVIPNNKLEDAGISGGGDTNITFQISTNDAKGFDDLLRSRRGLIERMLRESRNENMGRSVQ